MFQCEDFPSEYFHKFYYENVDYHVLIDQKNKNIVKEMKDIEIKIKDLLEKENLYPYRNNFKDYDISFKEILDDKKKISVEHAIQFKIYVFKYTKLVMKLINISIVKNLDDCITTLLREFDYHYIDDQDCIYKYMCINGFIKNYYSKYIDLDRYEKNKYFVITNWKIDEIYKRKIK